MLDQALASVALAQERALDEGLLLEQMGFREGCFMLLVGSLVLAYGWPRFGQRACLGINDSLRSLGTWAWKELFELCSFALVLIIFLSWLFDGITPDSGLPALVLSAVEMLIFAGVVLGLVLQSDGRAGLQALGLLRPGQPITGSVEQGSLPLIRLGVLSYLVLSPFLLGVFMTWPEIASWMGIMVGEQEVLVEILSREGSALIAAVLIAGLINPLAEEVLFRGFLQPILVRATGPLSGILMTSTLFAWMHGASVFLPIFAFSLLLGWLQLRTRCLWASWTVHALHNSLVLSLYLFV